MAGARAGRDWRGTRIRARSSCISARLGGRRSVPGACRRGRIHSCVATWWSAVTPGDACPPISVGATELTAQGLSRGGCRRSRPPPPSRRQLAATYGLRRRPPRRAQWTQRPPVPARRRTEAPAASSSPPAASGTRARTSPTLDARRHCCAWPVSRGRPAPRRRNGATVELPHMRSPLGALCARGDAALAGRRVRSSSRPRATSRSASPCWKPPRPAARSCSSDIPTFRELWNGAAAVRPAARRCRDCRRARQRIGDARSATDGRRRANGAGTVERCRAWRAHGRLHGANSPARSRRIWTVRAAGADRQPQPDRRRWDRGMKARLFHPLPRLLLEPRQRAFPARRRCASCQRAGTTSRSSSPTDVLEPREPDARPRSGAGLDALRTRLYPELQSLGIYERRFRSARSPSTAPIWCIVHEWNDPALVAAHRRRTAARRAVHAAVPRHPSPRRQRARGHRVTSTSMTTTACWPSARRCAQVYRALGLGRPRLHLARGGGLTAVPPACCRRSRDGLVWIGNWGDDERSAGAGANSCCEPAEAAGLAARRPWRALPRCGPAHAGRATARIIGGWLPNTEVPRGLRRHLATVHVPRRFYVDALPGIPTIRVFEALACGIPLVCAPWERRGGPVPPGEDFLVARDGAEMTRHLQALCRRSGTACRPRRRTASRPSSPAIPARTACDELLDIAGCLGVQPRTPSRWRPAA